MAKDTLSVELLGRVSSDMHFLCINNFCGNSINIMHIMLIVLTVLFFEGACSMTEKEIKKLNRQDLLILLAEQTARADKLEEKLRITEEKLMQRQLVLDECGTMAEASLKLNEVFKAADEAVAQYVENIKFLNDRQTAIFQDAEISTKKKEEEIIQKAEEKAARIIKNAQELSEQEIAKMDAHWEEIQMRIRSMDKEYSWLRSMFNKKAGDWK